MLSVFHPEVICLVADRIPGHSLGRLWLSGDKSLQKSLGSAGGVTSFKLELDNLYYHGWPHLVEKFPHLVDFSLVTGPYYHNNSLLEPKMDSLPRNLRSIEVNESGAATALINFLHANPAHFPHLESLKVAKSFLPFDAPPLEGYTRLQTLLLEKVIALDVASLPPSLTSLSFNAVSIILPEGVMFPSRLETLVFATDGWSYPETLHSSIPASLTALVALTGPGINEEELPQLTNGIKFDLGYFKPSLPSTSANDISELPSTTTELRIEGHRGQPVIGIQSFPPSLTSLVIGFLSYELASLLPKTLKSLDTRLPPLIGHLLPQELTDLQIDFSADVDLNVLVSLPPTLTSLSMSSTTPLAVKNRPTLTLELAEGLPRKLDSLTLQEISIEDPLAFEHLPPSLKRLNLKCGSLPLLSMKHAPSSLRTVFLRVLHPLKDLCDSLLSTMPTHVSEIQYSCTRGKLTNAGLKSLPPSLTSLIVFAETSITDEVAPFIPKDLKYVRLDGMRPPWKMEIMENEYVPLLSM